MLKELAGVESMLFNTPRLVPQLAKRTTLSVILTDGAALVCRGRGGGQELGQHRENSQGIEPASPRLGSERLGHYATAAPILMVRYWLGVVQNMSHQPWSNSGRNLDAPSHGSIRFPGVLDVGHLSHAIDRRSGRDAMVAAPWQTRELGRGICNALKSVKYDTPRRRHVALFITEVIVLFRDKAHIRILRRSGTSESRPVECTKTHTLRNCSQFYCMRTTRLPRRAKTEFANSRAGGGGVAAWIFAHEIRAGRCHWPAHFLRDLPFPPPLHSGAAPYTPRPTFIGSLRARSKVPSKYLYATTATVKSLFGQESKRECAEGKGGGGRVLSRMFHHLSGDTPTAIPTYSPAASKEVFHPGIAPLAPARCITTPCGHFSLDDIALQNTSGLARMCGLVHRALLKDIKIGNRGAARKRFQMTHIPTGFSPLRPFHCLDQLAFRYVRAVRQKCAGASSCTNHAAGTLSNRRGWLPIFWHSNFTCLYVRSVSVRCLSGAHRITSKHDVFGEQVVDYWWRVEFQCRRSPHLHIVVWLKDHPNHETQEEIQMIDRFPVVHKGRTSRSLVMLQVGGHLEQHLRYSEHRSSEPRCFENVGLIGGRPFNAATLGRETNGLFTIDDALAPWAGSQNTMTTPPPLLPTDRGGDEI
ncbi:hypothetical protein PR048_001292 [Dryococelus australis]|uniref:Helitron helicase-like domain-containing protein n=1 Tax=Dryococelus australis TaxID=614101 RepID=A0ABQ9IH33_9NEOP|nr:hypothetical protein PR048_001292 [Dryococelus australis]